MARPIPRLAPVTRATWPFRSSYIFIPLATLDIRGAQTHRSGLGAHPARQDPAQVAARDKR